MTDDILTIVTGALNLMWLSPADTDGRDCGLIIDILSVIAHVLTLTGMRRWLLTYDLYETLYIMADLSCVDGFDGVIWKFNFEIIITVEESIF